MKSWLILSICILLALTASAAFALEVDLAGETDGLLTVDDTGLAPETSTAPTTTVKIPVNLPVVHSGSNRALTAAEQRYIDSVPLKGPSGKPDPTWQKQERARLAEGLRAGVMHITASGKYERNTSGYHSAAQQGWQGPHRAEGELEIPVVQGLQGPKGDKGDRGDQGPPGQGNVTNVWNITPATATAAAPMATNIPGQVAVYQVGGIQYATPNPMNLSMVQLTDIDITNILQQWMQQWMQQQQQLAANAGK